MNFFKAVQCKVSIPPVVHHPADGRFAEMCQIDDIENVDELTASLVKITKSGKDAERVYSHILSEAMNNVCQHSGSYGFCAAQYWKKSGRIEFCIADSGCGLREGLRPAYLASDDAEAIGLAIRVGVTGRRPAKGQSHMRNRGVGLSCIERLVRANGGRFEIWSGTGRFTTPSAGPHLIAHPWNGTLLLVNMQREHLTADFHSVMQQLTQDLRLVEAGRDM